MTPVKMNEAKLKELSCQTSIPLSFIYCFSFLSEDLNYYHHKEATTTMHLYMYLENKRRSCLAFTACLP